MNSTRKRSDTARVALQPIDRDVKLEAARALQTFNEATQKGRANDLEILKGLYAVADSVSHRETKK